MVVINEEKKDSFPLVLRKSVGDTSSATARDLRFAMLGCENEPPYGPTGHTGALFIELIGEVLSQYPQNGWNVTIAVYRAQQGEYPDEQEWDSFDGVLLPGSFSTAYEDVEWIEKLKEVIQKKIVAQKRPTLGICFGHQILAHSFDTGKATKYSPGSRAGRYSMKTTKWGEIFFGGQESVELYYSHGDKVAELPKCAVALGEEGPDLPVQAAAYFKDESEAIEFKTGLNPKVKPYAITFQAHLEYAASWELGLKSTLHRILDVMAEKKIIDEEFRDAAEVDSTDQFDNVQQHSKTAFATSLKALGWIP